jgi:hypothetical protein
VPLKRCPDPSNRWCPAAARLLMSSITLHGSTFQSSIRHDARTTNIAGQQRALCPTIPGHQESVDVARSVTMQAALRPAEEPDH